MRKIPVKKIREAVRELCLKANFELRPDILRALKNACRKERGRARRTLQLLIENAAIARRERLAICQDTGMVFVHLAIGQDVRLTGGPLDRAVHDGVRAAYREGHLRKSVVEDPIRRVNTGTNAPCVIATDIVPGDRVTVTVVPKGFGSENKSRLTMLKPTADIAEVKAYVLDTVRAAGAEACPPLVLGIGIGGTFDMAAGLAKKALLHSITRRNPSRHLARLEDELLRACNALGIGPMGLGGRTTALGVNIVEYPTHIAGLPVAVNVSCHATRGASRTL